MKLKKNAKALLAVLLTLAIVATIVVQPGFSAKASGGTYKEMKFGDWATSAGTAGGLNIYSLTDPSAISSLNGVALSSTINFNGQSWGNSLITIGGTDAAKDGGFRLISTGGEWGLDSTGIGTGHGWNYFNSAACKVNGNVVLKLTFDKASSADSWTIGVYADETKVGTVTFDGVNPGLYIGIAPTVTVDMTPSAKPAPTYKEMYFSDWGADLGESEGFKILGLTDSSAITSLDGVAINGKVNFGGDATKFFRVGGTDGIKHAGFSLMTQEGTGRLILWAQGIGTDFADVVMEADAWAPLMNQDLPLRMAFSKAPNTNDWTVEVHINNNLVKTVQFGSVTPGLYVANLGVELQGKYKEMSFDDWGTNVGQSEGFDILALTDSSAIASLDGVAISGKVNFNGDATKFFRVGGTDGIKHAGFSLMTQEGTGRLILWAQGIGTDFADVVLEADAWATLMNTELDLKLGFVKVANANNWTVEVYINNALVKTVEFASVTPGLYIANSGVTLGEEQLPPQPTYTELNFSDWGTGAGGSGGFDIYTLTDSETIDSLDGVAISGKVNFGGNAANYFRIGGTDSVKHAGFSLMTQEETGRLIIWAQGIGTDFADVVLEADAWAALMNSQIDLRMAFSKEETANDWTVEIQINGNTVKTCTFTGVDPGLYIANQGVKIQGLFKEMHFSNWGTDAGTSGGFDIFSLTESGIIESLDGVAINGKVNFNGETTNFFRIGGTEDIKHAGFSLMTQEGTGRLIIWAQGIGTDFADVVMNAQDWAGLMNSDVDLRMTFVKEATTGVWTVEVFINGQLVKSTDFSGINPGLYLANMGTTIEGVEKAKPVYTEMSFSDWGVSVGKSEGFDIFSLTDSNAIASLDGVAISGKANFNGQAYKWLTIGGTADAKHAGFWLGAVQENGWAMACQGIGADAGDSIQWSTAAKFDAEVQLRLTFDKADNSDTWTVGVYADDVLVGTWVYDGATPGLYIGLDASLTVEGLEVKAPEIPTFPNAYTELKFSDFGIYDGTVEGMDIYRLKGHSDITSLDGVAISGRVNYKDVVNGRISIGGTDALKHAGFWLFSDGDNLRLSPQGIGNVTIDHYLLWTDVWSAMKNADVDLCVTFNKKADTQEWWVGIHINEEKIAVVNCGAVTPGMYLGVNPKMEVEGLGDAVKNGSIDFELFGYSNNNWRKEMGIK